jgi:alpha-ketoglutarate-dependent taurine dioxygenase
MAGGPAFWEAFVQLNRTGLLFVHGVPEKETSVEEIGRQIGELQNTFYGLTWDVVSKPRAENVAYTDRSLGLHQDLLYRADPPRIQLLHCLANECPGGDSIFSDGVRAAMELYLRKSNLFSFLNNQPVSFGYDKNGHEYRQDRRVIAVKPHAEHRYVSAINWAPPFQKPFLPTVDIKRWNMAARVFQSMISNPTSLYQYKMEPGECVVFDNRRVLHGRTQFDASVGKRWLKGAYLSAQTLRDKVADVPDEYLSSNEGASVVDRWADEQAQVLNQLATSESK